MLAAWPVVWVCMMGRQLLNKLAALVFGSILVVACGSKQESTPMSVFFNRREPVYGLLALVLLFLGPLTPELVF